MSWAKGNYVEKTEIYTYSLRSENNLAKSMAGLYFI